MFRYKLHPKTKVNAKYEVNISTSVVSTPYPSISITIELWVICAFHLVPGSKGFLGAKSKNGRIFGSYFRGGIHRGEGEREGKVTFCYLANIIMQDI